MRSSSCIAHELNAVIGTARGAIAGQIAQVVITVVTVELRIRYFFIVAALSVVEGLALLHFLHHFVMLLFKLLSPIRQSQNLLVRIHHTVVSQVCILLELVPFLIAKLGKLLQVIVLDTIP